MPFKEFIPKPRTVSYDGIQVYPKQKYERARRLTRGVAKKTEGSELFQTTNEVAPVFARSASGGLPGVWQGSRTKRLEIWTKKK